MYNILFLPFKIVLKILFTLIIFFTESDAVHMSIIN